MTAEMKLRSTLEQIISAFVDEATHRLIAKMSKGLKTGAIKGRVAKAKHPAKIHRTAGIRSFRSPSPNVKARVVHHEKCRVPGCKHQSKGPRYHFLCSNHRDFTPGALRNLGVK